MAKSEFLFPVLYTGPKDKKIIAVPGSPDPVVFQAGLDFDKPYAYVTETQGKYLRRIAPNLFQFPRGLMDKSATDDLTARIEILEASVAQLSAQVGPMPDVSRLDVETPKRRGRPKMAEAVG